MLRTPSSEAHASLTQQRCGQGTNTSGRLGRLWSLHTRSRLQQNSIACLRIKVLLPTPQPQPHLLFEVPLPPPGASRADLLAAAAQERAAAAVACSNFILFDSCDRHNPKFWSVRRCIEYDSDHHCGCLLNPRCSLSRPATSPDNSSSCETHMQLCLLFVCDS